MYKKNRIIIAVTLFVLFIFALGYVFFSGSSPISLSFSCGDNLRYMGESYGTVEIGGTCFFVDNLKTDKYRDGDSIKHIEDNEEWQANKDGAFTYYDNDKEKYGEHGKMYNFYALVNEKGLCPEGWRVPTDNDWMSLEMNLGMCGGGESGCVDNTGERGVDAFVGDKLKDPQIWSGVLSPSGFNATNGGLRNPSGTFLGFDDRVHYWTSTEIGELLAYARQLRERRGGVYRSFESKELGAYVRCMKIEE